MNTKVAKDRLSVVILAKNEQKKIVDCFKSVMWADEVVLIDTGSTDGTLEVAKSFKVKAIRYKGKGSFSDWRDRGRKEATGDWIFYLDADERVTPLLKREIMTVITQNKFTAYARPRRNFIFNKEFKYGGQWPDYNIRLFRSRSLVSWKGDLHEDPIFKGNLGYLKNPVVHLKHESLSEMVEKTNGWSEIEAKLMYEASHPPMNISRFISAMLREFSLRMVRQKAFLDGSEGIIYAMYQVYSRFISYAKLWEMQLKTQNSKLTIQN